MNNKTIWLREEIPIADELLSLAPKLTAEFLAYHNDFIDGAFAKSWSYDSQMAKENINIDIDKIISKRGVWKIEGIRYSNPTYNIYKDDSDLPEMRERYPTAVALTKKYSDVCQISLYSALEPHGCIQRHTNFENINREFLRIHIPLIIPEGDIYFEVEGTEIDWTDLYGFDDQAVHSGCNHTEKRQLVYLLDIRRSYLGIPEGPVYDKEREKKCPAFERGALPKLLHSHQK